LSFISIPFFFYLVFLFFFLSLISFVLYFFSFFFFFFFADGDRAPRILGGWCAGGGQRVSLSRKGRSHRVLLARSGIDGAGIAIVRIEAGNRSGTILRETLCEHDQHAKGARKRAQMRGLDPPGESEGLILSIVGLCSL